MGFDGLQWQRIDLPWAGGIGTKDHPFRQALPKASAMLNFRFQQSGALSPRASVRAYGLPTNPSLTVESVARIGRSIAIFGEEGVSRLDDIPGDDVDDGEWRNLKTQGPRSTVTRRRPIVRNEDGCRVVFTAAQNGRLVHVWSKTTSAAPEVWFLIEDVETGAVIRGPEVLTGLVGYDGGTSPASTANRDCVQAVAHANSLGNTRFVSIFGVSAADTTLAASITLSIPAPTTESVLEVGIGPVVTHAGVDAQSLIVHAMQSLVDVYGVAATTRLHRFVQSGSDALPTLTLQSTGVITGLGTVLGLCRGATHVTAIGVTGGALVSHSQAVGPLVNGSAASFYTFDATDPPPYRAVGVGGINGAFFVDCGTDISTAFNYGSTIGNNACLRLVHVAGDGTCTTYLEWRIWHVTTYAWPWPVGSTPDDEFASFNSRAVVCPVVAPRTVDTLADTDDAAVFRLAGTLLEWNAARSLDYRDEPVRVLPLVRRVGVFGIDLARPMETRRRSHSYRSSVDATDGKRFFGGLAETVTSGNRAYLGSDTGVSFQADCFEIEPRKAVWHGEVNGLHVLGSGIVSCMDEVRHAESMQMPPPVLRVVDIDTLRDPNFPGYYPIGSWAIRACWMWRDAKGLAHRSAPSPPIVINTAIDGNDNPFLPNVIGLRAAVPPFAEWRQDENWQSFPTDIFLELYTSPGGVAPTPSAPPINVDNLYFRQMVYDSIAFSGGGLTPIPDALVNGRELTRLVPAIDAADPGWTDIFYTMGGVFSSNATLPLYTNGGVLENDPTPSPVHMTATRQRLWLIDSEDRFRVMPSKLISPGKCPEFNQGLDLRVPTDTGELVALGAIDDLVLLFARSSVWALDTADQGPDDRGNGTFPPVRLISREVGCVNAKSVVTADVGCFFASAGGIYLLQANGQLSWVSRDLGDDYDFSSVRGATVNVARKEVSFILSDRALVFDYDHGQWSSFVFADAARISSTTGDIADAVALDDELAIVTEDGRAFLELHPDVGFDVEQITYSVSTGWLSLAGLLGFQRVRRAHLLGRFLLTATPSLEGDPPDMGTFTVVARYDFNDADSDTYTLTSSDLLALYYANKLDPLRLSFHLKRQRCQSLKLTFVYTPPTDPQGGINIRPELVGLGFEVGFKPRSRTEKHWSGGGVTLP